MQKHYCRTNVLPVAIAAVAMMATPDAACDIVEHEDENRSIRH